MALLTFNDEQKKLARQFAREVILRGRGDAYNDSVYYSLLSATDYAITQALDLGADLLAAADGKPIDTVRFDPVIGALNEQIKIAQKFLNLFQKKREEIFGKGTNCAK